MKKTTAFTFEDTSNQISLAISICILGVLGLWWIVTCTLSYQGISVALEAKLWIEFAIFMAYFKSGFLCKPVFSGANLMHHMRTPRHLWHAYLTAAFSKAAVVWGVLVLGSALLVYTSIPKWEVISMLACFSVLMCLLTAVALSHYSLWPRLLPVILSIAGVFALLTIWRKIDIDQFFEQFNQIPVLIRLAITLTWPALVWGLFKTWHNTPPVQSPEIKDVQQGFGKMISDWIHRFKPLTDRPLIFGFQSVSRPQPTVWGRFSQLLFPQMLFIFNVINIKATMWTDGISLTRLACIFFFGLCFGNSLVFKDLHWRHALSPGTLRRGKIGWHIFSYTALVQLLGLAILSGIAILTKIVFFEISSEQLLALCWSQRAISFEILFIVSVSACFGQQFSNFLKQHMFIGIPTVFVAMFLLIIYGTRFKWMINDWHYITGLCLGTLCLVLWANRLWTTQRIAATLHASS